MNVAWIDKTRAFVFRGLRFAGVGLAATAIYAAAGYTLLHVGLPVLGAHAGAYVVGLVASYFGQKLFTFGVRGQNRRVGVRFAIATAVLASSQFLLVWALERLGAHDQFVLAVSTVYYPPASFLLHSFWTFRKKPEIQQAASRGA